MMNPMNDTACLEKIIAFRSLHYELSMRVLHVMKKNLMYICASVL